MLSTEIRKRYLEFFEKRGHTVVPGDLLVPRNDPTLLFTGAGMNQFKEQFMGKNITYKRAASCQKCLRTGDLENVGKTPRHHTFFEMLGNFSFGDYFKQEAISWAWQFMTEEMGFPEDRLWISVYKDDGESYSLWLNDVKVPAERVIKLGADSNFWPANAPEQGPNGPCGPCSEIFYDWGPGTGCGRAECDPSCDCGRFVEVWNLVFTEFERKPDGQLGALPNRNIDTGMGLERLASVLQGVTTNFETDLFRPITDRIRRELDEGAGGEIPAPDIYRIADHVRAAVFAVADGVSPSNEKQGYVIRKLIRRAYLRSGKKKPFLYNIVPVVAGLMKDVYPELEEKREHISAIVKQEEERFNDTLNSALPVLEDMLSGGARVLSGGRIFKLVDTYGLPLDVVVEKTEAAGIGLDIKEFERLMKRRKEESRKGSNISAGFIFQPGLFDAAPEPEFSDVLPLETTMAYILKRGEVSDEIQEGEEAQIITSPQSSELYAEGGGQAGDTGTITAENAFMDIMDTCDAGGRKVLKVLVSKGCFRKNDRVTLERDTGRRQMASMNHTATHLFQAALRRVLGEHVRQSGSFVDNRHLRFDFTHMKKLSGRELRKVEDLINGWIEEGIPVRVKTMSFNESKQEGALSFFGEKYGDTVRMVSIGDVSKELCGGTHVRNTAEIGLVKILNESSVASGTRRVEAVSGDGARSWLKGALEDALREHEAVPGDLLKMYLNEEPGSAPDVKKALSMARGICAADIAIDRKVLRDYEDTIKPVFVKIKEYADRAGKKRRKAEEADTFTGLKSELDRILREKSTADGVGFVGAVFEDVEMPALRKALTHAGKKAGSGIILLGGRKAGRASLICAVTADLTERGFSARDIIDKIAGNIEGRGGGTDTFAQAGGKKPEGLTSAVDEGRRMIAEKARQ